MNQIGLIPSGIQEGSNKVLISTNNKIVYCSNIAAYVFRCSDFALERILTGHSATITCVAASPILENLVATSSLDKTVKYWDIDTGKEIKTLNLSPVVPLCLEWSSNDQYGLFVGISKGIRLYREISTSNYYLIPMKESVDVLRLSVNPKNPNVLVASFNNGCIGIINIEKKSVISSAKVCDNEISVMDWDPFSSSYIIIACKNGEQFFYDIDMETQKICRLLSFEKTGGTYSLLCLKNEPGNFITGDSRSGTIRYWNVSQQSPQKFVKICQVGFRSFSKVDKERIAVGMNDGSVGIINLSQKKFEFRTPGSHYETIFECSLSILDCNVLATSSFDGTIKLWDVRTLKNLDTFTTDNHIIYGLSWNPEFQHVAACSYDGHVYIYDTVKRVQILKHKHHSDAVYRVCYNPNDPTVLASSSKDKTCVVFKDDGTIARTFKHPDSVFGLDWCATEKNKLATGCFDYIVRIFNMTSDSPVKLLKGHKSAVYNVSWHPTLSNYLASGSNDKTVRVWNVETGDSIELKGHTDNVRALKWNPEITYMVLSGSWDGTIRVWDVRNGSCLSVVNDHHADIYGLSIHSRRPFFVVSSSRDTTIRFWSLQSLISNLEIRIILKLSLSGIVATPKDILKESCQETQLCGIGSKLLSDSLKESKTQIEKYKKIFDFLAPPFGMDQLWKTLFQKLDIEMPNLDNENQYNQVNDMEEYTHLSKIEKLLSNHVTMLASLKNQPLLSIGGMKKSDIIKKSAEIHLLMGNLQDYCENMVEIGEWEKAISVSPGVSIQYWKQLCSRYTKYLTEINSEDIQPYYIANGDIEKLLNYYVAKNRMRQASILCGLSKKGYYKPHPETSSSENTSGTVQVETSAVSIATMRSDQLLEECSSVLASLPFFAIDEEEKAIRALEKGNEISIAFALMNCLNLTPNSFLIYVLSAKCMKQKDYDLLAELLQKLQDKVQIAKILSLSGEMSEDIEKLYLKTGFQNPSFYCSISSTEGRNKQEHILNSALGALHDQACRTAVSHLDELFSREIWDWDEIQRTVNVSHCIDATKVTDKNAKESLIAYCSFVGAQIALWKSYYQIAPKLMDIVRQRYSKVNIPRGYLDYFSCLVLSFVSRTECLNLMKQAIQEKTMNEELMIQAEKLKECLQSEIDMGGKNRNVIVPLSSKLPLRSLNGTRPKSFISKKDVESPQFVLEDGKSVISGSEAIMWHMVNPFSPLCTGARINPF